MYGNQEAAEEAAPFEPHGDEENLEDGDADLLPEEMDAGPSTSSGPAPESVFVVDVADEGQRLDVFLAAKMAHISRSQLQRLIGTGSVQVNGVVAKPSQRVQTGDLLQIEVPAPRLARIEPQNIPLDVVYEDADLLVINKPAGLVVHPAPGAEDGTLVNALLYHCVDLSGIGGEARPGIVHRLDKDTTGLMMVAKNDVAHNGLQRQIQRRTASRRYLALVWGSPNFEEALIDAPIGRHPSDRRRMAVIEPGSSVAARPAQTNVRVQERFGFMTLLECALQTGRTHQIRVHTAFAGYPVVGDPLYGNPQRQAPGDAAPPPLLVRLNEKLAGLRGQALHAFRLSFEHPRTGAPMDFEQPPPPEMRDLLALLREIAAAKATGGDGRGAP
jgi:pseudouridine synthase, RluA family